MLPSNIVAPQSRLIKGKPAGFADGVDDGIVQMTTAQVVGTGHLLVPNAGGYDSVACPAGSHVISGGFSADSHQVRAVESLQYGNGWLAYGQNVDTLIPYHIYATAVCLTTDPIGAMKTRSLLTVRHLLSRK
jgi:hypothetical protein